MKDLKDHRIQSSLTQAKRRGELVALLPVFKTRSKIMRDENIEVSASKIFLRKKALNLLETS